MNALFPSVQTLKPTIFVSYTSICIEVAEVQEPFSVSEVTAAALSLSNGKAPDRDEIPNEFIKVPVSCDPQRFQHLFNRCVTEGCFPARWKKGKLVLIPKPSKPPDSPSALDLFNYSITAESCLRN